MAAQLERQGTSCLAELHMVDKESGLVEDIRAGMDKGSGLVEVLAAVEVPELDMNRLAKLRMVDEIRAEVQVRNKVEDIRSGIDSSVVVHLVDNF